MGDEKQQPFQFVATANELFKQAIAAGCVELDFSVVEKTIGSWRAWGEIITDPFKSCTEIE
jgi:hypothetical protein